MVNIMKTRLAIAEKQNKRKLSEMISISYALGVNVTPPSRGKDALKILNVVLLSLSAFGLYGQYCYVVRYADKALAEYIECILTAFQTIISITKLIYFLFVQEKFYQLLSTAKTGKIVQQLEIFDMDIPMTLKQLLSQRIIDILEHSWIIIRRQLVFYMCCSTCISCNYFVVVLVSNTYHQIQGTENYTMQTSFPSLFPMWESKGFQFPYYEIQFIAVGCENFISGMSAVSFDGIFIVLTLHGMALLRILHLIISYSTHDSIEPNLRLRYLRYCIHHFQRIFDLNVVLLSLSAFGLYGQYCYVVRYADKALAEYIECILTAFQTIISITKLIYFLFVQEKFYQLLSTAQSGKIVQQLEIFDMAFPSLFPMWESKGFQFPYYEIQFIAVGCENFISYMSALSFDGIFNVLTLHGLALLRILHLIIRYSTHDSIEPNLRLRYLRYCIHHFQRIFDFYEAINDLYGHICLAQFGISVFILCMVLYQASIGLETDMRIFIKMLFYMVAASFQVLIYCYNGQRMTTESEKLEFAWYNCNWYQESKEFKELIKMMILRSNRTMPIQVSGLTTMNLATFLWIMQTSESYFLLLRNVA